MLLRFLLTCCACVYAATASKHDAYRSYSVHTIQVRHADDLQLIQDLQFDLDLDIWQYGMAGQRDAEVMVSPEKAREFLSALDENGLTHSILIADVAKSLEDHENDIAAHRSSRKNRMIFNDYPRYAEVDSYMERMAATYPNLVTIVNAGPSFEGRAIKYLKISTTNFTDASKPIYFMDAMMHAREWVTTPVALYSIHRLLENRRPEDQDLLDDIDWIILPIVNPDGYEFSHTDNRLWRKTRSVNLNVSTECIGVDANRNFDIEFNTTGVSTNPCSNLFPGPYAFSEVETQYVRDILLEYLPRIQLYNDIHSHGNYVLFCYANKTLPPNAAHIHHIGAAMGAIMDSIKLPQARFYLVGNSGLVLYPTSGSADDYAQVVGVPFSYTMELPGYGYEFMVPPSYMDHMVKETWEGIAVSARLARIHYRRRFN
ncbi:carboxypeptidase B [Manduca sexta]|uniref:carboxypeptidase B n=1 Tax=Manduca sexta TaxID=7130 RepID=UPI00188DE282|nr:carboxypeptidase B [Manduca sexta]